MTVIICTVIYLSVFLFFNLSLNLFCLITAFVLSALTVTAALSVTALTSLWVLYIGTIALIFNPLIRRDIFSKKILALYLKVKPNISDTEREALDAGNVGWEGQLFAGRPHWHDLLDEKKIELTPEERAFLDGPVEQLCQMANDWQITHEDLDLSPEIWQFLKEQGFFALIIPKRYGGKEFSALAHSEILLKLASVSLSLSSTVAVPNSLGPAELLLHYGTEQQKEYYLPRLASGEEIPCFALTSPQAGSDAGSIPDTGVVCYGEYNGEKTLGIRLNWDKRYITLAPVATTLGLAFKLYDPEKLLSSTQERGITCALIPVNTPGIEIGKRHFPLNIVFQNGPTRGKDVFIPVDWIIGGRDMAGQGWRMLVQCLACGRAISLPSSAIGGAKAAVLASGAYARIRKQFNLPIGKFEGIAERLARMANNLYITNALRLFTVTAIDRGDKPSIPSAISKYHTTERCREIAMDAMDVHGGKGICMGPRNYLARSYQGGPISVTVEGANILARNMIIFGQGAIRCHPYILDGLHAANIRDQHQRLIAFDKAIWAHIGFSLSNIVRSFVLSLGFYRLLPAPKGASKSYFQHLSRFSANFSLLADWSLLSLGAGLKRKESISARLGDVLSDLYMASTVLKYQHDYGAEHDAKFVDYACQSLMFNMQNTINEILENFPARPLAWVLRVLIFPLGRRYKKMSVKASVQLAEQLQTPSEFRDRLGSGIYLARTADNPVGFNEYVLEKIIANEPIERILQAAIKSGQIESKTRLEQIKEALAKDLISNVDEQCLLEAENLIAEVIAVDEFSNDELRFHRRERQVAADRHTVSER